MESLMILFPKFSTWLPSFNYFYPIFITYQRLINSGAIFFDLAEKFNIFYIF